MPTGPPERTLPKRGCAQCRREVGTDGVACIRCLCRYLPSAATVPASAAWATAAAASSVAAPVGFEVRVKNVTHMAVGLLVAHCHHNAATWQVSLRATLCKGQRSAPPARIDAIGPVVVAAALDHDQ